MEDDEDKQCRTCLHRQRSLVTITSALANMIHHLTQLQVTSEDGLSQWVCSKCFKEIKKYNKFRRMCLDSVKILEGNKISQCLANIKKEEPLDEDLSENKYSPLDSKNEEDHSMDGGDDDNKIFDATASFKSDQVDLFQSEESVEKTRIKTVFSCPYCRGPFMNMKIFETHMKSLHEDKRDDDFRTLIKNSTPLGVIHKNKGAEDVCKCACGEFTSSKYPELLKHFKSHYGDKPIVCSSCDFKCANIGLLKSHIIVHSLDKPFSCTICNYACKSKTTLNTHMETHSGEKNYKCKLCPQSFKWMSALSHHKRRDHEKQKNHVCDICQKAFFSSQHKKLHMTIHTKDKPHICHLCGACFSRIDYLKRHITSLHEDEELTRKYKCHICGTSYKHMGDLNRHIAAHKGIKDFKCDQCPYLTNCARSLKIHILRHAKEYQYACELCDYKCYEPARLRAHQVVHTGEKNYPCDICSYACSSQANLKNHKETHNTELKYYCPKCSYKTNSKENLRHHKRLRCPAEKREKSNGKNLSSSALKTEVAFDDMPLDVMKSSM